ncbi:MAG: ATP-binding protein, partial [Nitrospirae bacterium]|nr:ATP-binding protein [Nitrospirota bacterium]
MNKLYEFTPGLMSSDVLISISMGRDREISRIESILLNASSGGGLSNPIFIGPKGIGKTHVLNIIYRSIRGDRKINEKIADLAERFTPVLFSEEEYVSDITRFVLLILRYPSRNQLNSRFYLRLVLGLTDPCRYNCRTVVCSHVPICWIQ